MGRLTNRDWWGRAHMRRIRKPEGGSTLVLKRAHATRAAAEAHAADLAVNFPTSKDGSPRVYAPYPCRWGDDPKAGPCAPLHWHVGQDRTAGKGGQQS